MSNDSDIITSDALNANMFNKYFASVGIVDDGTKHIGLQTQPANVLYRVEFDKRNVLLAI